MAPPSLQSMVARRHRSGATLPATLRRERRRSVAARDAPPIIETD